LIAISIDFVSAKGSRSQNFSPPKMESEIVAAMNWRVVMPHVTGGRRA
jgi:hypothetical protein